VGRRRGGEGKWYLGVCGIWVNSRNGKVGGRCLAVGETKR